MTPIKKIYISLAVFVILMALLIVFGVYPLFLEIKKNSQDFLSQKQKLMVLEKKVENLNKLKIIFPEISTALEKINNLFVDSETPVDFISFLEKTSQDSQLLLEISAGPAFKIGKDPWPSISFQLDSVGSFPSLLKFLEKLKSSFYLIEIQNLTITRLTETELRSKEFEQFSLGDVKATLSIKVYTK